MVADHPLCVGFSIVRTVDWERGGQTTFRARSKKGIGP